MGETRKIRVLVVDDRTLFRGEASLPRAMAARGLEEFARQTPAAPLAPHQEGDLTPRDRQVLAFVAWWLGTVCSVREFCSTEWPHARVQPGLQDGTSSAAPPFRRARG
jgi:hypothetical protein